MSLTNEQKAIIKSIAQETVDDFNKELTTVIIPAVVRETLLNMGADTTNRRELQSDFLHLRTMRKNSEAMRTYGVRAAITGLIAFIGAAVWFYLKKG